MHSIAIIATIRGVDGALSFDSRALGVACVGPHELLRKSFLELADQAGHERVSNRWTVAQRRAVSYRDEFGLTRNDGAERWFPAVIEPLRDAANHATPTWFGTLVDVHASHLATDALRERVAASLARSSTAAVYCPIYVRSAHRPVRTHRGAPGPP